MMSPAELWYRTKKLFALYPGVLRPVSGSFLASHYARRRHDRDMLRAVLDAAIGTAFHLWVPLRAAQVQRRLGLDRSWRRSAIAIAHARFADPNDIALFRVTSADDLDGYIRRFEDAGLNKRINLKGWQPDCALADKIRFYERCVSHDLPHPNVFATIRDGRITVLEKAASGPLLLKPARGEGGRGVRFLDPPEPTATRTLESWLRELLARQRGPWLVQQRIVPHEDLRDLALGALPTARITTIMNEGGVPEVVSAVLRIPSDPAAQVDNMKAGGLLSPIELATGALGIACKGYGGGDFSTHPVTGASIPGRLLPHWPIASTLAIEAHRRAFADYTLIGWDIGFAPSGPILIEGNAKPGVLMPQRAGRRGLGDQRYGELLAFHLARKLT